MRVLTVPPALVCPCAVVPMPATSLMVFRTAASAYARCLDIQDAVAADFVPPRQRDCRGQDWISQRFSFEHVGDNWHKVSWSCVSWSRRVHVCSALGACWGHGARCTGDAVRPSCSHPRLQPQTPDTLDGQPVCDHALPHVAIGESDASIDACPNRLEHQQHVSTCACYSEWSVHAHTTWEAGPADQVWLQHAHMPCHAS